MSSKCKNKEERDEVSIVYWLQSETQGNLSVVFQLEGAPKSVVLAAALAISSKVTGEGYDRRNGNSIILVRKCFSNTKDMSSFISEIPHNTKEV